MKSKIYYNISIGAYSDDKCFWIGTYKHDALKDIEDYETVLAMLETITDSVKRAISLMKKIDKGK